MAYSREADFENDVITVLCERGWSKEVLRYPTQEDLIANWAQILFENNNGRDKLNGQPLTRTEMDQVLEQVAQLRTPLALNGFINGKSIAIKRDNPADPEHLGKEVSLKIYDRDEIASGKSRYQIAQQPLFSTRSNILNQRRGDLLLLINGMPVIHLELKKSGVAISEACDQIKKYMAEGVFTGIFSLVQVFVALTPDDEQMLYFANPGSAERFNQKYFFHWADYNNQPFQSWRDGVRGLLSIPAAHQLIGYYTVADGSDGVLKVMRSYQIIAAQQIASKVTKTNWEFSNQRGGFIWHTTGSGKTMTSFKSAQLIANSANADKVVFLVDRIELGTQSLREYRGFSEATEDVQSTENTGVLVAKLKSNNPSDTLIVTSIQKMSKVTAGNEIGEKDLAAIAKKRLVFIVDECHRSQFGDMHHAIKTSYPQALFFGFTGTPIQNENQKKQSTTADVFGDELHRYTIADGIRDGNVLGFDPHKISTFDEQDLREAVALHEAHADTVAEALSDPRKAKVFRRFMDDVPMAYPVEEGGKQKRGIEDYLPPDQYDLPQHREAVIDDILKRWDSRSVNGKFHAIFATASIPAAIDYYRRFKARGVALNVTALFDPNIDNTGDGQIEKEEGLEEIITDYNALFNKAYTIPTHAALKRDMAARVAHKDAYKGVFLEKNPSERIDILIVVDQMLTGFDSKWVNTLYLDKILEYENIIQAFSRTNRLFPGQDKSFGTICYYRSPNVMEQKVQAAVRLYSGEVEQLLFAPSYDEHVGAMATAFAQIKDVFEAAGQPDFATLPEEPAAKAQFVSLFRELNASVEAAKVQGFTWDNPNYVVKVGEEEVPATLPLTEEVYLRLVQRYKEYVDEREKEGGDESLVPSAFDIDTHITNIATGKINTDYMNANFRKWLKALRSGDVSPVELDMLLSHLHKSFASLSAEQQKYAMAFLSDIEAGDAEFDESLDFLDYITEYQKRAQDRSVNQIIELTGVDREQLLRLRSIGPTEQQLDDYDRFTQLMATASVEQFQAYLSEHEEGYARLPVFKVKRLIDRVLRSYILRGDLPDFLTD